MESKNYFDTCVVTHNTVNGLYFYDFMQQMFDLPEYKLSSYERNCMYNWIRKKCLLPRYSVHSARNILENKQRRKSIEAFNVLTKFKGDEKAHRVINDFLKSSIIERIQEKIKEKKNEINEKQKEDNLKRIEKAKQRLQFICDNLNTKKDSLDVTNYSVQSAIDVLYTNLI